MTYHPPIITILNDHEFELVEPFVFEWTEPPSVVIKRITIPAGYPFDGASVPRICWTLTDLLPTGVHLGAAAVHDYLYQRRGLLIRDEFATALVRDHWLIEAVRWERKRCDWLFHRIMLEAGETAWKREAMYHVVRRFGKRAWDR